MDKQVLTLEDLKGAVLFGYLMFTDAVETGENRGDVIVITDDTKPGVDQALMNAGYNFDSAGCDPLKEMYWMQKAGQGSLRYHPIKDKGISLMTTALNHGMKTRIDFFYSLKSDLAYNVADELLKLGHRVLFFSPHSVMIKKLFLAERGADNIAKISEVAYTR